MTNKTKAPRRAPENQGLAYLIEDILERSEGVIAAGEIVEKLQKMAEDLGNIQVKDIMPLIDGLTNTFGQQVAEQFNTVANEQISQLITAVQSAKSSLDNEILRLKKGIEGGDMSDMGMGMNQPPPGGEVPGQAPPMGAGGPEKGMPEITPDIAGNTADDMAGGFAGRERKESVKVKGKRLAEFVDTTGIPGQEKHPHKSDYFHGNLDNLTMFHGGLGRLARNVESAIDSGKLNGSEREGLANALSHMASVGHDAAHWADPDAKLESSLKINRIVNRDDPTVAAIIHDLRRLAHGLSLKHHKIMETSIIALRKSTNPDALVLKTFRVNLSETRDGQTAAIRTARLFAIDIEDVVSVVKEAKKVAVKDTKAKSKTQKSAPKFDPKTMKKGAAKDKGKDTKKLPPWLKKKEEVSEMISSDGKKVVPRKPMSQSDWSEEKEGTYSNPFAKKNSKDVPVVPVDDKELKKESAKFRTKKVSEDTTPVQQRNSQTIPQENITGPSSKLEPGVPLFPVDQANGGNAGAQMSTTPNATATLPNAASAIERGTMHTTDAGAPDWSRGNQSQSTRTPMKPADKRFAVAQSYSNDAAGQKNTNTRQQDQGVPGAAPQTNQTTDQQPIKQPPNQPPMQPANRQQTKQDDKRRIMPGNGRSPMPNIR